MNSKEIKPANPKGNQPWICISETDAEAEALIIWCEELTTGKDPDAMKDWGGEGGDREWDGITDSMDISMSKLQKIMKDRKAWNAVVHGVAKSQTWLSDWTTTITKWL